MCLYKYIFTFLRYAHHHLEPPECPLYPSSLCRGPMDYPTCGRTAHHGFDFCAAGAFGQPVPMKRGHDQTQQLPPKSQA